MEPHNIIETLGVPAVLADAEGKVVAASAPARARLGDQQPPGLEAARRGERPEGEWRWGRAGPWLVGWLDLPAALAASEERFDLAARAARDLLYDFDIPGDHIRWGGNAHEVFGLTREQLGHRLAEWTGRIHPDDLARVEAKVNEAIAGGTMYQDEYRFRRGDGSWAVCRDRGLIVRGPDGQAARMVGSMEDCTERREAHERLAASEARHRLIAENTSDVVYDYLVQEDRFLYVSPRAESWLGVPARRFEEERGLWWELMRPDDQERVGKAFAQHTAERRPRIRYEYHLRTADGRELTVHDAGAVTYDDAGRPLRVLGTVSDVGELRALQAELARSQRLESVGRLAGGIAHDFNNVLTGIVANAGLATSVLPPGDPAREHVHEIERAAQRAAELVRGLLAYARQVEGVVRLLRPALGAAIDVRVSIAPGTPPARADAARLEQVLVNLALNARDAMPGGGRLRLAVDAVTADDRGEFVRIAVEDTGAGMTPDVLARAFEPFFTTKGALGSGLGLAVVQGIVQQHAGWIDVSSDPSRGSRFVVHLPGARGEALRAPEPPPAPARAPRAGEGTIVLADDEPAIRRAVAQVLGALGYEVLVAADGAEAVEVWQRERARVDAVVLDLTMPRVSGQEALERMRAIDPEVRVVLTSGYPIDDGTARHAAATLVKPYSADDLAAALRKVIRPRS